MESDIDQFIQNQKAKLQQERQLLADDERGERVGRRQWEDPGRGTQYAEQHNQDSSRKPEVDYEEWDRSFQKEKQKDYNDYLEKLKHRQRKLPTPPGSGMKFGEFEEYRKRIERQRKQEYSEELKKQQDEQLLLKAQRDYNNIPFIQTSPRLDPNKEKLEHEISDKIMEQKFKEFDKMMSVNKNIDTRRREQEKRQAEQEERTLKWRDFDEISPRRVPEQETQPHFERPSEPSHYQNTYRYQKHQQQLKEEREKETRQFLEQRGGPKSNRKPDSPKQETGLQLGKYEDKRKKLEEERKKEYNELLAKQALKGKRTKGAKLREERAQAQPQRDESSYAQALPQRDERSYQQAQQRILDDGPVSQTLPRQAPAYAGNSQYDTRQLQEEKEREYYDLVNKLQQGREDNSFERRTEDQERPSSLTANEKAALTMLEEKEREYQQLLKERQERQRDSHRDQLPPKPPTPGGMFNKLGAHDRQREKLNEERKEEYNKLINEGDRRRRSRGNEPRETYQPEPKPRPSTDDGTGASLKGLNPRDSAEIRKKQLRNEEYNEFLRQKGGKSRGQSTEGRPPLPASARNPRENQKEDIYATLPGLKYNGSAEKRKIAERNREYNEMLEKTGGRRQGRSEPPGPRRGWQSPSYEDILDRKRQQEAQYRHDDPAFSGMRAYNSEGAINNLGNDRYDELDREYETRKVRFRDRRSNILDNDQWLDGDRRESEYRELQQPPQAPRGAPREEPPPPPPVDMAACYATLPLGANGAGNERDSAKRRRQEKYKEDLHLQMREKVAGKRREKEQELKVDITGWIDPEKTKTRVSSLGNPDITPRRVARSPEVRPYHTQFVSSPRTARGQDLSIDLDGGGGYEPRERGRSLRRGRGGGGGGGGGVGGGGGLLDTGFEALLEPRQRASKGYLPPGLEYQPSFADPSTPGRIGIPSSYLTGGNPQFNSTDNAYFEYASRDLLQPEGTGGFGGPDIPLNHLDDGYRGRTSPRVTFDPNPRSRSRSRERISPYQFDAASDGRSKSRQDQREYQLELERQIHEKKEREKRAKEEQERYDKKLEAEIRDYNPYGRGGAGAPLKDNYGNVVADLKRLQFDGNERIPPPRESPRFRAPGSPKDDLIRPPPAQQNALGEQTQARGGHGIFGQPKTDAEKDAADRYKDELRKQIEDKKRQEQIEKEKERIEEEKENRRLEEQRKRIQQEYDEEVRKKREKEEEARRKNDEMRQQAEERKKEEERKRREAAEAKSRERQEQIDRERAERQTEQRGGSPPIPALRSKLATENGEPSTSTDLTYSRSKPPRSKAPAKKTKHKPDDFELGLTKRDPESNLQGYDLYRTSSVSLGGPSPKPDKTPSSTGPASPVSRTSTSDGRGKSPPVPSHRREKDDQLAPAPTPLARANSSDVLKELATMRKQLQTERKRVENALHERKNEPEIFDPRLVQRAQPSTSRQVDVFEMATKGHAAVPQRTTDTANTKQIQEFNDLKQKPTGSRSAFRSIFPDYPQSNSALETQQDALIRQQEDQLKSLKDRNYGTARQGTLSPKSMLNSNSAFIDAEGVNHFPDDFEDLPKRNESARLRRRERYPVSPRPDSISLNPSLNPMGSTTSLDVDRIQRKNDARLRRLQQMNADDVSMANPDDILDRFMAKQTHNRPPSTGTLIDDSWILAGNR